MEKIILKRNHKNMLTFIPGHYITDVFNGQSLVGQIWRTDGIYFIPDTNFGKGVTWIPTSWMIEIAEYMKPLTVVQNSIENSAEV